METTRQIWQDSSHVRIVRSKVLSTNIDLTNSVCLSFESKNLSIIRRGPIDSTCRLYKVSLKVSEQCGSSSVTVKWWKIISFIRWNRVWNCVVKVLGSMILMNHIMVFPTIYNNKSKNIWGKNTSHIMFVILWNNPTSDDLVLFESQCWFV